MARVLVIDDEWTIRQFISAVLKHAGHEVFEAANGEEGLRLYEQHRPGLVLCDILMPRVDGLETIQLLAERVPIIAMSGGGSAEEPGYLFDALAFGAAKVLEKPFDPATLLRAVEETLRPGATPE
jgi:sigma-B regulation protein RsbU (phosphoserine phosphatase)